MSQNEQILDYLEKGNSITAIEALDLFDCFRLSARIGNLKDAGHKIKSVLVKNDKKKFSRYFME